MGDYNAWYSSGWTAAQRSTDLEAAEARFLARNGQPWNGSAHVAFEDGWMDWACGRPKWHLRDCPAHPNCESPLLGPNPDPWGPGGKFIDDGGLKKVPCPRCGAADVEAVEVPRSMRPGAPVSIRCRACGKKTSLNTTTGEWDLSERS